MDLRVGAYMSMLLIIFNEFCRLSIFHYIEESLFEDDDEILPMLLSVLPIEHSGTISF